MDSASTSRSDPSYVFDFCGSHLAADFTNTIGNRGSERQEHLRTYGDLVAWAEARGLLGRRDAAALRTWAGAHADAARRDLARALTLREALYRTFAAIAREARPRSADLATVNRFVADGCAGSRLVMTRDRFVLQPPVVTGTDRILQPVVRAAVELLTSAEAERLGTCADEGCGWVFVDRTRSRTRRWCDMSDCGNRNKIRRFRSVR